MKHETTFIFSLAISPDAQIIASVRELKLLLGKRLGRNYRSMNSLGHITLFTFLATMDDYPEILTRIGEILAGLNPFELKFSGFAFFPPRPDHTFYIKPDESSGKQIIKYCKTIQDHCDMRFRKKYSWTNEAKKDPHMSVGHDILESEVSACNTLTNDGFEKSFSCDSFVIRRFNESKRQYDIIDTIPLLGQEYIAGEQLALF